MVSFPSIPRNVNLTVDSGGANCYDDIFWKQCGSPTSPNMGYGVPFFELKETSLIAVTSMDFMNFRLKISQVVLSIDKEATKRSHRRQPRFCPTALPGVLCRTFALKSA